MRSALKMGVAGMAVAGMLVGGGTAFAQQDKDAIRASVSIPAGEPVPVITENGHGYTPGNYAVGITAWITRMWA